MRIGDSFRRSAAVLGLASRWAPVAGPIALLAGVLLIVHGGRGWAAQSVRVVSLSPEATEVLIGIGAAQALVAVDEDSRRLDGLGTLPVVDLADAEGFTPDVVLVPKLRREDTGPAERLRARGTELLEFAPHNFDDAFDLCRALGVRLGRLEEARTFIRAHSRELAQISNSWTGLARPRVAALVELHPLVVAGGHSFVTDLIEIAGAESVTHGVEELRVPMSQEELLALRPDLVLVTSPRELSERERDAAREALSATPRLDFIAFDPQSIWLRDAAGIARQLRSLLAAGPGI